MHARPMLAECMRGILRLGKVRAHSYRLMLLDGTIHFGKTASVRTFSHWNLRLQLGIWR